MKTIIPNGITIPKKLEFGNIDHINIVKKITKVNEHRKYDNEDTICGGVEIEEHQCDCEYCDADVAEVRVLYRCYNCNCDNDFHDHDDWGRDNAVETYENKEFSCKHCGAKHISLLDEDRLRYNDIMNIFPLTYEEPTYYNPNQLKLEI
jgi:Zn finger protein HypA/HybF involved in hydrogenase expression